MAKKPGPKPGCATKPVTVRLPLDLISAVDAHAVSLRLNRTKVIELVLHQNVPPAPKAGEERQIDLFA